MRVLVVEDDAELRTQLSDSLRGRGHHVECAMDGRDGLTTASKGRFDVMVIDRMMPKMDGLTMLATLRKQGIATPALILSALGQVDDRVDGLRAGGDDYLAKPYAFSELLARLEVLARRRPQQESDTTLQIADLTLDRIRHVAERAGKHIPLQPREYRLLDYFMQSDGKIVTRTMLLENVWDLHFDPQTNVIDVHVSRLRAKIDKGFDKPLIHTVRGKGYRFGEIGS